jgi:flagellar biosynthetic protein FliR
MNITADISWLISILLLAIRLGAVFLLTPILAVTQAPARFRLLFVLALSALLVSALPAVSFEQTITISNLIKAALQELIIGAGMAFGLFTAFGAFLLGGRVLDFQMGFGVASLIDPSTNTQSAMMGVVLNLIAIMVFFLIDGHHMVLKGLAYSIEVLPLGQGLKGGLNIAALVAQFGSMFIFALMVVAPAIFSILLLDVGLGVMARTMPQVNVFFVGIPLKIFIGMTVTALTLKSIAPLMKNIFEGMFYFWQEMIGI